MSIALYGIQVIIVQGYLVVSSIQTELHQLGLNFTNMTAIMKILTYVREGFKK